MTPVPLWNMFAYSNEDDDGASDEYRTVPEWRTEDAFRWARYRGYDTIVFTRAGEVEFHHAAAANSEHGDRSPDLHES